MNPILNSEVLTRVLKEYTDKNQNIVFGYLFGSYAIGKQTQMSDIDIAVYLRDSSFNEVLQINYELSKLLKKDVDLIVLNDIKNLYLLEAILKDGKVIKDNDLRFDFEIIKEHEILDFKENRKYIDAA